MQNQPIRGVEIPDGCTEEERTDCWVIGLMLREGSWPWSVDELARELANRPNAEDSICRLTESGLVHRLGDFVFPTRTARRAAEIELGTL